MKIRYCWTTLHYRKPCDVGWGSANGEVIKTCHDDPMEENCKNIVNTENPVICPTCGTTIGIIGDYLIEAKNDSIK